MIIGSLASETISLPTIFSWLAIKGYLALDVVRGPRFGDWFESSLKACWMLQQVTKAAEIGEWPFHEHRHRRPGCSTYWCSWAMLREEKLSWTTYKTLILINIYKSQNFLFLQFYYIISSINNIVKVITILSRAKKWFATFLYFL